MAKKPLVIAVDLGGTQIRVALSDMEGNFIRRVDCPTEAAQGQDAVLRRLAARIQEVRQGIPDGDILGVGIGSPGPVDALAGLIISPPNLPGWEAVPLRDLLEQRTSLPVRLANDANAAALGEWAFGKGRGRQNVVYVTISTGVGGGVIAEGRLLLGHRGLAAEVGHMTLQPDGPRCNCGNYGCWEALASGTAIAREGAEVVRAGRSRLLAAMCQGVPGDVDARMVGAAATEGDAEARRIIELAGYYSGIGVATLIHLYSPEIVLIGGGVSRQGALLLDPLRQVVQERVMPPYRSVPIEPAALEADVGLLGTVALFL